MEQALARKPGTDIVREGYFDLSPRSLSEAIQLAELMAKSDLIQPQFRNKPGDVLIAVQYGAEVGLKPLQAMQGIAVINGRPTIWGDAALGVVLASGLMVEYKEMTFEEIEKAGKAVFWAVRKGRAEPIVREFSIEDAKRAHLWNNPKKPIWMEYWPRMLQMRARGFGLRDGWSDILKGMSIREEVEDIEVAQAPAILAMPRRMSEREEPKSLPEQTDTVIEPEKPSQDAPGSTNQAQPISQHPPACPKCGGSMHLVPEGITKSGKNAGKHHDPFWGCEKKDCKGFLWAKDVKVPEPQATYAESEPDPFQSGELPREPGIEG